MCIQMTFMIHIHTCIFLLIHIQNVHINVQCAAADERI